jgi:hypothetical protein
VVTNARVYYTPRAAAGASDTRLSLRPLFFWADVSTTTRAHRAAGARKCGYPSRPRKGAIVHQLPIRGVRQLRRLIAATFW